MTIYDRNVEDVDSRCVACDFWTDVMRQTTGSWLTMYAFQDRPLSEKVIDCKDVRFCPMCGKRLKR